jgi:Bacterial membrane protein YfhO
MENNKEIVSSLSKQTLDSSLKKYIFLPGSGLIQSPVIAILLLLPTILFALPLIEGRPLMSLQNAESVLVSPSNTGSSPAGFYALNALLDYLSPTTYVNVIIIAAYQLAVVGVYLFGRRLGMNVVGAVISAVAFTFGGLVIFLVGDIGAISYVTSAAWVPWIMLAIESLYQSSRWRWVVIGSLCMAFQLFFGEPQMILFTFFLCLAYVAYHLICGQKRLRFTIMVAMMWLCGFMMATAQIQAMRELFRPTTSDYEVHNLLHSGLGIVMIIYLTLLIILSLLAAIRRKSDKRPLGFWTVTALSCILLALIIPEIQQTIRLFYEFWINRLFTEPAAYLYVCVLCASILTGFAVDFILPACRENFSRSLASMFATILLLITTAAIIGVSATWKKSHSFTEFRSRPKSPPWEEYIKTQEPDFGGFRIFTHSLKPNSKLPTENISLDKLSNANTRHSKGVETITAKNLSSIFNEEISLSGANLLTSQNQFANLLNVKYMVLERSGEPGPTPEIHVQGIKFDHSSTPIRLTAGKKHSEILPPQAYASEVAIISTMGGAADLIDNTPIAKIKLHLKDGRIITQEVLAGRDTGEWSYDNPEIRRIIKHRRPTIALDTSNNGVFAYQYLMRLPFGRSEISQIDFDYLLADAVLMINHISLFDAETGVSTPLSSFDIITDKWRKLAEYGEVEIYRNRNFLPRARFIEKAAVTSRADILQIIKSGLMPDGSVFNPSHTALLESENLGFREGGFPEIGDPVGSSVTVSKDLSDKISLKVQNNHPGFLVLSEFYRDGVECYIDGRPTDAKRVNYALLGVAVPAGDHTIQFAYQSFVIDSGTLFALFGIIILLAGAVAGAIGAGRILDVVPLRKWTEVWINGVRLHRLAFFTGHLRSIAQSRIVGIIRSITESRIIGIIRSIIRSRIVTFLGFKFVIALATIGLLAYGYAMVRYSTFSLGGCDTYGYGSFGKLIYQGRVVQPVQQLTDLDLPAEAELQSAFIPLAYGPGRTPGTMIPNYPLGFPLQIAVASVIFGLENGPWMVSALAATFSLVLIWLIGMEFGLSRNLALLGAIMLGLFPTIPYNGIQLLSDVPAMFWCLAVIFAALRSRKNPLWAIAAGFAFGMAFLTRPTNAILIVATLLSLRLSLKTISYFVIGGLPTACVFLIYNYIALGSPIYLGYGVSGEANNFHLHILPTHFKQFTYWLSMLASPLLLAGWAAIIINRQIPLRDRSVIIVWFGAFFLLYCLYDLRYDIDSDWAYVRFLLPGIPPLIIGSLLTTRYVVDSLKQNIDVRRHNLVTGIAFSFLLIVVIGASISRIIRFDLQGFAANFGRHKESCIWADKFLPQDALVISMEMGGSLEYYTNRQTIRFDQIKPTQWDRVKDHAMRKGRPFYAFLMTHEVPQAKKNISGRWEELGIYKTLFTLWKINPE